MKRRLLKRIVGSFIAIWILLLFMSTGFYVLNDRDSEKKYHDFFEISDDIDVIFMGTSHVMNGIVPLEIWNQYGITSYNFGNPAAEIPTQYWTFMNMLDYCNPKVVVIDCYGLNGNLKISNVSFAHIHKTMDCFRLSNTKIKAAIDLVDDPYREAAFAEGKMEKDDTGGH